MKAWLVDILDHVRDWSWKQWLVAMVGAAVIAVSGTDIAYGEFVSNGGVVQSRYTYISTDQRCVATDKDGNCSSWTTEVETHYVVVVAHQGMVEPVEVYWWDYLRYPEGSKVQISYWQGGFVGIHWFTSVSDPQPDF